MTTRNDISQEALSWIGTPWKHQGRSRRGVDCCGLVVVVGQQLGLDVEDVTGYNRRASNYDFLDIFRKQGIEVPLDQIRVGDVVCFTDRQYPCHCGIMVNFKGAGYFVHSHALHRRVILGSLSMPEWRQKLTHAFRYRGIE